jgi:hypothetical protein
VSRFSDSSQVLDVTTVTINLLVAALLATVLGHVYVRFGKSISNRRMFAANFVLLACTTTLVIAVVKSSLALSLGMVGALSIVRFRSAVKEPEELAYLFLTIGIGLGLGADQIELTVSSVVLITGIVSLRGMWQKSQDHQNLFLSVASNGTVPFRLSNVIEVLKANCPSVDLRRFDERVDGIEAAFLVEFDDPNLLEKCAAELRDMNRSVEITFSDHRGIL